MLFLHDSQPGDQIRWARSRCNYYPALSSTNSISYTNDNGQRRYRLLAQLWLSHRRHLISPSKLMQSDLQIARYIFALIQNQANQWKLTFLIKLILSSLLSFEWKMDQQHAGTLEIDPRRGTMQCGECQVRLTSPVLLAILIRYLEPSCTIVSLLF